VSGEATVLLLGLILLLAIGWIYLLWRLQRADARIARLEVHSRDALPERLRSAADNVSAAPPEPPPPVAAPSRERSRDDWEALLGGDWLNKAGIFVLVVGIALALGYSFTRIGPWGRVGASLAVCCLLLASGVLLEHRPPYNRFARGLLGGGWAALYVTVFAMHSIPAARVVESSSLEAALLLAVSSGMIAHSLRYHSQALTGVAYFAAFGTLGIVQLSALPYVALIPLAVSLLYVAHRCRWMGLAVLGVIAAWAVCVLHAGSAAILWQAQAAFTVYWLAFELFDVAHPEAWLLPWNALGFAGLSLVKWEAAAPERLWMVVSAGALAYLIGALARVRSRRWQGAATLALALATIAIFLKLERPWVAIALTFEAELCYLLGVRLKAGYLRWLGTCLFALPVLRLLSEDLAAQPPTTWVPSTGLDAALFYMNQALYASDSFYGYAGGGMLAMVVAREVSGGMLTVAWGLQGLTLLIAGFPLRDRVLRISGLILLLFCILKLFGWDLRHLDTLPRILSFLVLGLILVGVSWVYTRFRGRITKYL